MVADSLETEGVSCPSSVAVFGGLASVVVCNI